MKVDVEILIIITVITVIILFIFFRMSKNSKEKMVYLFITLGLYVYSGYGIAYASVDNRFLIKYVIFIICILLAFKVTVGEEKKGYYLVSSEDIDFSVGRESGVIRIFAFLFIATLFVYLITPRFRLQELVLPPIYNAIGIHARSANKNIVNRIADTINIATRPFFHVYLQQLAEKKKKKNYLILTALWIYLEYLQLGYLSRYQMMIYVLFVIFSFEILEFGEIVFSKKTKYILMITLVVSIPLLVAFVSFRNGKGFQVEGFLSSIEALLDGETYYPIYYERIVNTKWNISPITFLLWIICLPIPSFIWRNKPYVDPSYALTTNLYGFISKSDSNYYNSLPSMLGESMMIFGNQLFFFEAIIIGFFVGLYFRFLYRSKHLNVLTLYMTLMLLTLGRGGATSYMSGLINGTIILIVWVVIEKYYSKRNSLKKSNCVLSNNSSEDLR